MQTAVSRVRLPRLTSLRRLRSSSIFVAARKHATDGEAAPDPALAVGVSQSCASPHLSTSLLSTSMWKRSSGEDPQQDHGQVQVEGENPAAHAAWTLRCREYDKTVTSVLVACCIMSPRYW